MTVQVKSIEKNGGKLALIEYSWSEYLITYTQDGGEAIESNRLYTMDEALEQFENWRNTFVRQ